MQPWPACSSSSKLASLKSRDSHMSEKRITCCDDPSTSQRHSRPQTRVRAQASPASNRANDRAMMVRTTHCLHQRNNTRAQHYFRPPDTSNLSRDRPSYTSDYLIYTAHIACILCPLPTHERPLHCRRVKQFSPANLRLQLALRRHSKTQYLAG